MDCGTDENAFKRMNAMHLLLIRLPIIANNQNPEIAPAAWAAETKSDQRLAS